MSHNFSSDFDINVPSHVPTILPRIYPSVTWNNDLSSLTYLHTQLTCLFLNEQNSNTIKFNALHKHILLRIIKPDMECRKCPIWLEIWYQLSQLRPWDLDIVPWWLSHARHIACKSRKAKGFTTSLSHNKFKPNKGWEGKTYEK